MSKNKKDNVDDSNPFSCSKGGNHDLKKPVRLGRAHYVCRHCGENITLLLVYLLDLEERSKELKKKNDLSATPTDNDTK